jgi:hypothetical protein
MQWGNDSANQLQLVAKFVHELQQQFFVDMVLCKLRIMHVNCFLKPTSYLLFCEAVYLTGIPDSSYIYFFSTRVVSQLYSTLETRNHLRGLTSVTRNTRSIVSQIGFITDNS